MREELFEQFLLLNRKGLRRQATERLEDFIRSFNSLAEKQEWTEKHLSELEKNGAGSIRHELFAEIIFPVLFEGYKNRDARSLYLLAMCFQNLYANKSLWNQIDFKTDFDLLKEARDLDAGSTDIRNTLLKRLIRWFRYCEHEWPTGILYGHDGATLDECAYILAELELARELDTEAVWFEFFSEFEAKVRAYQSSL